MDVRVNNKRSYLINPTSQALIIGQWAHVSFVYLGLGGSLGTVAYINGAQVGRDTTQYIFGRISRHNIISSSIPDSNRYIICLLFWNVFFVFPSSPHQNISAGHSLGAPLTPTVNRYEVQHSGTDGGFLMDHLCFWNKALTAAEVLSLYQMHAWGKICFWTAQKWFTGLIRFNFLLSFMNLMFLSLKHFQSNFKHTRIRNTSQTIPHLIDDMELSLLTIVGFAETNWTGISCWSIDKAMMLKRRGKMKPGWWCKLWDSCKKVWLTSNEGCVLSPIHSLAVFKHIVNQGNKLCCGLTNTFLGNKLCLSWTDSQIKMQKLKQRILWQWSLSFLQEVLHKSWHRETCDLDVQVVMSSSSEEVTCLIFLRWMFFVKIQPSICEIAQTCWHRKYFGQLHLVWKNGFCECLLNWKYMHPRKNVDRYICSKFYGIVNISESFCSNPDNGEGGSGMKSMQHSWIVCRTFSSDVLTKNWYWIKM